MGRKTKSMRKPVKLLNPNDPRWDWCFGLPLPDKLALIATGDRTAVPAAMRETGHC
ncbi:hypothetical protein [Planctomicrobium sp. SH664]|uniref:hypothetical protein n=1 Tax=Planctomicrobium sp. SH664 TaxID=3448125 RepID=UPI003F5B0E18